MTLAATSTLVSPPPLHSGPPPIGIARRGEEYRVIALELIRTGARVMEIDGLFVDKPSRYSVQLGHDIHVEPPPGIDQGQDPERYRWRYLNHSCNPNSSVVGRHLIALREIEPWHEITFDYNTTELEMASPFACRCGHCEGRTIRGFRHLSSEEQLRIAAHVSSHLRALLPRVPARGRLG